MPPSRRGRGRWRCCPAGRVVPTRFEAKYTTHRWRPARGTTPRTCTISQTPCAGSSSRCAGERTKRVARVRYSVRVRACERTSFEVNTHRVLEDHLDAQLVRRLGRGKPAAPAYPVLAFMLEPHPIALLLYLEEDIRRGVCVHVDVDDLPFIQRFGQVDEMRLEHRLVGVVDALLPPGQAHGEILANERSTERE